MHIFSVTAFFFFVIEPLSGDITRPRLHFPRRDTDDTKKGDHRVTWVSDRIFPHCDLSALYWPVCVQSRAKWKWYLFLSWYAVQSANRHYHTPSAIHFASPKKPAFILILNDTWDVKKISVRINFQSGLVLIILSALFFPEFRKLKTKTSNSVTAQFLKWAQGTFIFTPFGRSFLNFKTRVHLTFCLNSLFNWNDFEFYSEGFLHHYLSRLEKWKTLFKLPCILILSPGNVW